MPTRLPRSCGDESSTSVPSRTDAVITGDMAVILAPLRPAGALQHALCSISRPHAVLRPLGNGLVRAVTGSSAARGGHAQVRETVGGGTGMTRSRSPIAAALCLTAPTVHAQGTQITGTAGSASHYKSSTNVRPV